MGKIIAVFGSSRPLEDDPEYAVAYNVGKKLGRAGFTVCNGGYSGIMTASAHGAKDAGAETIGVITSFFQRSANQWIDKVITMPSLIERLMKLVELGDGYVVLKGGTGTLLELSCVWEFINKGLIPEKPIVVLGDFWGNVIETLRNELLWEGLGDCTRFISRAETPEECARLLRSRLA